MRIPFHAGHTLGLGAALILPIGLYAARGIAPLFIVITVLTVLTWKNRRPEWLSMMNPLSAVVLALPMLAFASALWSLTPLVTLETAASFAASMVCGIIMVATARNLTVQERATFLTFVMWGGAGGFALMALDLFFDGPVYRPFMMAKGKPSPSFDLIKIFMNPGATVAAIYSWIWIAALWARGYRWVCLMAFVALTATVWQAQAETPIAAILVGATAFAIAFILRRFATKAVGAVVVASIMVMPFAVASLPPIGTLLQNIPYISPSLSHRITIWQTAVIHWQESPIVGLGFDTTRSLYGSEDKVMYSFRSAEGKHLMNSNFEPIPLHPHNGFIQTWLEMGALGAIIVAAIAWLLFQSVGRSSQRLDRCFGQAHLCAAISVAAVSFGAWQSWWLCSLLLMCALMTAIIRNSANEQI